MIQIIPGWLTTLIAAFLPISEVRGAIPLAVGVYGYSPAEAYLISVFGNLLPVIPLLLFLGPVSEYLRRFEIGDRFFTWLFARTRRKCLQDHENFGLTALAIFVATPLPMTGAWTGCALAFLLGFRFWPAFAAIATGILLAGAVVTATVMGVQFMML
ncbi:MAG: putative small multi-drug export protein [Methanosaeta sp. PtaU1.Bin060]|nr:MAG: putative small multi-drug export protein [Methanosaeta sp. PtaU1.Bin060]